MPQGLTVPAWYNDNYYINEKVDECNAIKFGQTEGEEFTPWTADTVRDFMAGVHDEASYAPWMGYDNFVTNGNDEFCSPNPLFNVMQYLYAKADQLNALNDGAGYGDNANNWTGQLVLDFFKANNISAWDHFTTSGQFEGINPSNAMDLSEFLDKKAAQCNEMEFDGKSDWTPETVLDYYQEHGMNPVMVAVNDRDPNVVAVPEDEAVTVPAGLTPWGPAGSTLVEVYLDKGADDVTDNGVPTNFIGTIETSNSNSTFTSDDKITGTNDADVLTVTMAQPFGGMRNGFVTGVPTVDLVSNAASDVTFNTKGITGVETYNVNGQITLAELAETGIAVNLSNIYEQQGVGITFADGVAQGPNDSLKLGVENVYFPDADHQPSGSVAINSPNIEDLSITSNGVNRNILNLDQVGNLRTLAVDGDCDLGVSTNNQYLKSIDASAATGNVRVDNGNSQITDAKFGTGNDTLSTNNLLHNATVDGGEGEDTLVIVGANTTYDLNMTNVETLTVNENQATVTVEGGNISGLKTLKLDSTNSGATPDLNNGDDGYRLEGQQIILSDYNEGPLTVQAVNFNNANVRIADVQEVTVHVGDGVKNNGSDVTGKDEFRGSLTLGSANTLTVNVNDTDDTQALFRSLVTGDQVSTLNLNVATDSELTFRAGSELSALSTINATGFGEISLGGQGSVIGTKASAISVNTSGMNNGSFTAVFENSEMDGKTLVNVDGSNMVDNNISVDNTFKGVSMQAGAGDDTLTLVGNNEYSKNDYRADLGDGYNRLIVKGEASGDLSNIKGVDRYVFTDMTKAEVEDAIEDGTLIIGTNDWNIISTEDYYPVVVNSAAPFSDRGTADNDAFALNVTGDARQVTVGGAGGHDSYTGVVNAERANLTLVGQDNAATTDGSVNVKFAAPAEGADPVADALNIYKANNVNVYAGQGTGNSITGNIGNILGTANIVAQGDASGINGAAIINLNSISAAQGVDIIDSAAGDLKVTGNITSEKGTVTVDADNAGAVYLATTGGDTPTPSTITAAGVDLNIDNTGQNANVEIGNVNATTNKAEITVGENAAVPGDVSIGNVAGFGGVNIDINNGASSSAAEVNIGTLTAGRSDGTPVAGDVNLTVDGYVDDLTVGAIKTNGGNSTINLGQNVELASLTLAFADAKNSTVTGNGATITDFDYSSTGATADSITGLTVGKNSNISTGDGNDNVNVTVSNGNETAATVTINTGAGDDSLTAAISAEGAATNKTTLEITCGTGIDTIKLTEGDLDGIGLVKITGFDGSEDKLDLSAITGDWIDLGGNSLGGGLSYLPAAANSIDLYTGNTGTSWTAGTNITYGPGSSGDPGAATSHFVTVNSVGASMDGYYTFTGAYNAAAVADLAGTICVALIGATNITADGQSISGVSFGA